MHPSHSVSVIVPAYRSAATIRRAVDSVLAQTHAAAEIIVVDDGSPDEQVAVIEQAYGPKVVLVRQQNGGAASARNAGIDRSTGEHVAFLDADDYWEPEKLASQLDVFKRHPELGLVAASFYEETPGKPRPSLPISSGPASWYEKVLTLRGMHAVRLATMIWTGTVLLRREALGSERFQRGLEPAEDRDLWIRIASQHPAYLMKRALATAVLVEGSLSRSSVDHDKASMLRVVERHRQLLGPIGVQVWRSFILYRWAAVDPVPRSALPRLVSSVLSWPLPYAGLVDAPSLGRLRRLAVLLRASLDGATAGVTR